MKAFVFAAGLGTRLKPITDSIPKALLPVGGETLLGRLLDKLQSSGVEQAVVNVHHFPDQIIDFVNGRAPGALPVLISDERDALLETGGALKKAAPLLRGCGSFYGHNVDILSNVDLGALACSVRPGALATLVVSGRETSRYLLFDEDMRLVGWTNVNTGEVRSPYPELDVAKCRKLAFSGIHVISDRVFDLMEKWPERFSIVDFYLGVLADYPIYGYVPENPEILDVGKISSLESALQFVDRNCPARTKA